MEGVLISTCGMWNAGDSQGMDGSNRGPWFGAGAILITGADLYDTPNGEPPETTAQDVAADSGDFGFSYDLWLDLHPLRCVDAGLTCSAYLFCRTKTVVQYEYCTRSISRLLRTCCVRSSAC